MTRWYHKIRAFWLVPPKDVLPDPDRSTKREGQLQHEQFAYIARIKRKA
jgi:hypothetical protein